MNKKRTHYEVWKDPKYRNFLSPLSVYMWGGGANLLACGCTHQHRSSQTLNPSFKVSMEDSYASMID